MNIALKLSVAEIIYDIQNKTYLTGKSVADGSNHGHVANMQANDDDENAAQIMRSVTTAYAVLKNRLSEYIDEIGSTSNNDCLTEDGDITLTLKMPSNFNSGMAETIGKTAHDFIVASAVADWFAITAKGETIDYKSVADESLRMLDQSISKRKRPVRGV